MREFWVLLRYRWLAWRHAGARKSLRGLGLYGLAFFVLQNLILALLVFYVLFALVTPAFRHVLLRLCAHGLAAGAMVLVLATAVNTTLGSLYEAPQLSLLFAMPVRPRALYAIGVLDAAIAGLSGVIGLIVPAWVALTLAARAPSGFALLGLAGLAAETLFGVALVGLILSLILRFVSAARVRRLLIGALLVGLVGLVLLLQVAVVQLMSGGWRVAAGRLQELMRLARWLPHGLAAQSALAVREGRPESLSQLGTLLLLALGMMAIDLWIGGRSYAACWSNAQEEAGQKSGSRVRARVGGKPWPTVALVSKDWLLLLREPLFWANMLVFVLGIVFYAWSISQNQALARATNPLVQGSHLFFISFFATGWLAQAGAMAVSREGLAWWQIQAASLRAARILWAKILFGTTGLALFFVQAWLVILLAGLSLPGLAVTLALAGGLILGLGGAGLLADLALPDFTLKLGVKMSGAYGGGKMKILLATVVSFAVTAICGVSYLAALMVLTPVEAALVVAAEGMTILLGAALLGLPLLQRVLVPEA